MTNNRKGQYAVDLVHPYRMIFEKHGNNKKVAIIGTDLNEETLEFLKKKRMSAVIDQNPYDKGYMAFKIMVDCLIKNMSVPDVIPCRIDIALENNADLCAD